MALRRGAANFNGKAVSYARRFQTSNAITVSAAIPPTTHGHTGIRCSLLAGDTAAVALADTDEGIAVAIAGGAADGDDIDGAD